jgi:hypothetical protein
MKLRATWDFPARGLRKRASVPRVRSISGSSAPSDTARKISKLGWLAMSFPLEKARTDRASAPLHAAPNFQSHNMKSTSNTEQALQSNMALSAAIAAVLQLIDDARCTAHASGLELGERLLKQILDNRGDGFVSLRLMVRRRGGSVTLSWAYFHFRGGRRTGITMMSKRRRARHYDLDAIEASMPSSLVQAAVDTELGARALRETLAELLEIERGLLSMQRRLTRRRKTLLSAA